MGLLQIRALICVAAIAALYGLYAKVRHDGYAQCQSEVAIANAKIKEKQSEIAINRPDTDALIGILRLGRF